MVQASPLTWYNGVALQESGREGKKERTLPRRKAEVRVVLPQAKEYRGYQQLEMGKGVPPGVLETTQPHLELPASRTIRK